MANKDEILQTILIHNGLYKRKVFLDSLSEGLEIYKIHSLMKIFLNLFKPVFTSSELSGTDIIQKIVPCDVSLDDNMLQLISCLFECIFLQMVCQLDGKCLCVRLTTICALNSI